MGLNRLVKRREVVEISRSFVIRLGETKTHSSGSDYPVNVPYFVLTDAPEVEEVYGKNPQSITIMFTENDPERVTAPSYRMYGAGKTGTDGKRLGGKLKCKGDGPLADGSPGVAEWTEKNALPPKEEIISVDPETRVVKRQCYGKKCIDAFDAKGRPKCKESMIIKCIVPLVSFNKAGTISTSSRITIDSVWDEITWLRDKSLMRRIAYLPFRIYKTEMLIPYTDPKTGKESNQKHFVVKCSLDESFLKKERQMLIGVVGKEAVLALEANLQGRVLLAEQPIPAALMAAETHATHGMEDNFPSVGEVEDVDEEMVIDLERPAKATPDQLKNDPELTSFFEEFGRICSPRQLTEKDRLIWIWTVESKFKPDDLKSEVRRQLLMRIAEKKQFNAAAEVRVSVPAPTPPPPPAPHIPSEEEVEAKQRAHDIQQQQQVAAPPASAPVTDDPDGIM